MALGRGKLYDLECNKIEYRATADGEGDEIKIVFQPIPPELINTNNNELEVGPNQPSNPKSEWQKFGPRLDTYST